MIHIEPPHPWCSVAAAATMSEIIKACIQINNTQMPVLFKTQSTENRIKTTYLLLFVNVCSLWLLYQQHNKELGQVQKELWYPQKHVIRTLPRWRGPSVTGDGFMLSMKGASSKGKQFLDEYIKWDTHFSWDVILLSVLLICCRGSALNK